MINYTSQRITKVLGLLALTGLSVLVDAQTTTLNWAPAGPIYNAGRARNMVVDKNDPQVLYVGSASSGIFKSLDGGSNWAPINDQASVRNISYLAQAHDGSIYAGTGEGFLRPGQKLKAQVGTGLYKLNASGVLNLVASSSIVGTVINRIACNPNNASMALATNMGIFYSTDGTNFTQAVISGAPVGPNVSGQDVKFDANGNLYCSIGTEAGVSNAATASKVFKADPAFSNFAPITPPQLSLPDDFFGRIELAIAPSNNNVIYASCANKFVVANTTLNNSSTLKGLYVSYDAGQHWALIIQGSPQLDPLSNGGTRSSGDYAHAVKVHPTNPDMIFYGGYSFYVFVRAANSSTANPIGDWFPIGQSFNPNRQDYLHENIHDIQYINGATPKMYFITDAGIYRSIDLPPLLSSTQNSVALNPPSFQPFYKGLVTGQFNSVSIERYPIGEGVNSTTGGSAVNPYSGFIGGTGGNGLTYFSGTQSLVTTELNYIGGEVYNSEYSKILPNAVLSSVGNGVLYRSTNIKISDPTIIIVNKYANGLSTIAPTSDPFSNSGLTTGTPFKLWENYGQIQNEPDSAYFYNDSVRYQASSSSVSALITQSTFSFSTSRPNKYALIDSIVIRTGTVVIPPQTNVSTAFTASDRQTIYASTLPRTYSAHATPTVLTTNSQGPVSTPVTVTLSPTNLTDLISVTFTAPPFATKTITSYPGVADPSAFYRVFATVYYKYKAGDEVMVVDNNISTRTTSYTTVLSKPLNWKYGTTGSFTLSALTNPNVSSITNPTFVLSPGSTPAQTNPTFVVSPPPGGSVTYSIFAQGTYTLPAVPVVYTIEAVPNTTLGITPPLVYSITPGNYTQSTTVFTVDPTSTTVYTITESGSNALTSDTYSTVGTSTYVISPTTGTISQSGTVFIVSPTVTTTYTVEGLSSNTAAGANTSTTYIARAITVTSVVGSSVVSVPASNKPVKIAMHLSARLAIALNNPGNTGGMDAIVVSKNALALNDPLSVVRISQNGAWTDDANGNPTTNVGTVDGKPILLEWSKSGTELYYATSANKVYRVSHINEIMDLSPSSYSGKFYTDIFKYTPTGITNGTLNPESPYRTTLIGTFDKTITSISVSNDNKNLAVTFSGITGTTGLVMYNTNDARTSNTTSIGWTNKQNNLNPSVVTYCSLMEKDQSKKVFLGTDNGMFFTEDISATPPNWVNVNDNVSDPNSKLPNVQIFDIKQQTFSHFDCYNSGQIYVATNGRGIWTNGTFFKPFLVGIEEEKQVVNGNNMSMFPNPTNGDVNIAFNGVGGETAFIQVMDISGRVVYTEKIGKLNEGDITYTFSTSTLNSGVYLVNVNSDSGVKRISKLVVTK